MGEGVADAGFIVSWTVEDSSGAVLSCNTVNAYSVKIEVADARGETLIYNAPCDAAPLETEEWEIAAGKASVSATLLSEGGIAIASAETFSFEFVPGRNSNVLPDILFVADNDVLADAAACPDVSVSALH